MWNDTVGLVLHCSPSPEDALCCIVIRPGMAFRFQDSEKCYLCVANLRWCIMGWPFEKGDAEGTWALDPVGAVSIHFMYKLDQCQCSFAKPMLNPNKTIDLALDDFVHPVRCCLEFYTAELVHHQLICIAELCGLCISKNLPRSEVLRALALHCGDEEFAEKIVSNDPKSRAKSSDDMGDLDNPADDLAELILESMDKEELSDFKEILNRVSGKEKVLKKRKWQMLLQKHLQVIWQSFGSKVWCFSFFT